MQLNKSKIHRGNLRSGNRGGSEEARRRATPASNEQPQPKNTTPQRDRRIMLRTRAQGQEGEGHDRGEGGKETKKRKEPQREAIDAMWETGETWAEIVKSVDKKVMIQ